MQQVKHASGAGTKLEIFFFTLPKTLRNNQPCVAPKLVATKTCTNFFQFENLIASLDYLSHHKIRGQCQIATTLGESMIKSFVQQIFKDEKYCLLEMREGGKVCLLDLEMLHC